MAVQLLFRVKGNRKEYYRGQIVSFEASEEKRLINEGIAVRYEGEVIDPSEDDSLDSISQEEYQRLYASIDDAGNADKVKAAAIAVGLELSKEDTTKKAIIEKIIVEGYEEEVLEELKKGE